MIFFHWQLHEKELPVATVTIIGGYSFLASSKFKSFFDSPQTPPVAKWCIGIELITSSKAA
jgi:hypothetical protein